MEKRLRSPDITDLRAFCAAVDLGSISRAARLLHVSQPALSKRLRALEAVAGTQLLDRSARGVSSTPAGSRLYAEARKLVAEMENVDALMSGLTTDATPIRLAASPTVAEFVLPGPLVQFEGLHERHLSVELFVANSTVVRELVREARAEIGMAAVEPQTEQRQEALKELPLRDDEVVIAVPREHAWATTEEVEVEDFMKTPMVMRDPGANSRRVVESVLAAEGLSLASPLVEVGSTSAAKATALSKCVPALLSELALRDAGKDFVISRVRGLRFTRRFVIILASERALTPGARALVDHLLQGTPGNSDQ